MMVLIALILILGGCQKVNKDEDAELISQAKATAIKHMKDEYGLDVEITYEHKLPTYVSNKIDFKGNVKEHQEQTFDIAVDYKTQEISNFLYSPELKDVLIEKGYKKRE
ncbi:hypothetical protein [Paenibacillus polymyxa]|uniref:hypothetical protein n=1 Tax=Paenibacillus polymyxa TaxID=1406 RepID=UPI0020240490|nr:hypothetical protein [Paenibacillus polymyxa]URJ60996.3 hypothetical protein MF622_000672 [Paenibacillus polymyxa]